MRDVKHHQLLTKKVLPGIYKTWSRLHACSVESFQQNVARLYFLPSNSKCFAVAGTDEVNVELTFEPSNRPALKVLDVEQFIYIQSF